MIVLRKVYMDEVDLCGKRRPWSMENGVWLDTVLENRPDNRSAAIVCSLLARSGVEQ